MSNIDFGGSITYKTGLFSLMENKFKSEGFINSTKKGQKFSKQLSAIMPIIEFYNSDVKKSKMLHDYQFTNFLKDTTKQSIKTGIYDIFTNPSVIDTPHANEVRVDKDILERLKLYYNPIPPNTVIIKSNMVDGVGLPKEIRVFAIMELETQPIKATYKIILVDPFHLVIPSYHAGKSKDEMQRSVYDANRENNLCMNEYVRSI